MWHKNSMGLNFEIIRIQQSKVTENNLKNKHIFGHYSTVWMMIITTFFSQMSHNMMLK